MNTPDTRLTPEQMQLVREIHEDYGIEHDQLHFFGNDLKPTFDAEAGATLARKLAGAKGVAIGLTESQRPDTITMECGITLDDFFASAVGSANVGEKIDGQEMSLPQLERLASSRALRSALVMAGIDLVKLHRKARNGNVAEFTGPDKSLRERLLSQAHALGNEAGLIAKSDKSLWYQQLYHRYQVKSSAELSEAQLSEWIAFLSSLRAPAKLAA